MLKKWLLYPLTLFCLVYSNSYAAGPSGVSVTHCTTNCGKVLVGSARIDMASIQWQGADSNGLLLALYGAKLSDSLGNRFFGFTGSFDSNGTPDTTLIDYTGSSSNKWFFVSTGEVSIGNPATGNKAPKLGFYFSPNEAKSYDSSSSYFAVCTGSSCQQGYPAETVILKGEGAGDSKTTPALTLDVKVNGATAAEDVAVASRGVTQFSITPRLNQSLVPADAQTVKYAQVLVKVDEKSTSCTNLNGLVSFYETQEEPNDFSANSYYHHLTPESSNQGKCSRVFSYLVSIDRAFNFTATNQQTTGTGYVQYTFFINGHYNPFSPVESDYPNSHQTFRLRTDSTIVSNQKPVAAFSLPTSINLNQSITLDASASTDSDGSIVSYEWSSSSSASTKFTSTASKTTGVYFTQAGNYAITLKVTDDDGDINTLTKTITVTDSSTQPQQTTLTVMVNNAIGGTVKSTDNAINCTSTCSATYTKNASVTLTPVATTATAYKFDSWSTDCAKNGVASDGSITVTMDQSKTCTVTFAQKITPVADNACFTMEYLDDRVDLTKDEIRKVKLDASCSGTYSQYKWRLYSDTNNTNVALPTTTIVNLHDQFTGKVLPDGNYIVTLMVGEGETQDQISQSLTIPPVLAKFNISSDSRKIIVDATPSSKSKDSSTISYQWWTEYLGKLTADIPGVTMSNTSHSQLVIDYTGKNAALTGNYYETITLAITDSKGRVSTLSQKAKVNLPAQVKIDDFSFVGNPTTNADGSLTVTLRGQATDQDGGLIIYTFTDGYGRSAAKVETVSDSDGREWRKATFNYGSQEPIAEAYILQVEDGETGTEKTTATKKLRVSIPTLASATVNKQGSFGNTNTIFHGGVSIDRGRSYRTTGSAKTTQQLAIRGYFEVDPADVGQQADILVIAGIENQAPFNGGVDTSYWSYGATALVGVDLYQSPDVWMAQLTNPFMQAVTLATDMPLAQNLNLQLFTGTPSTLVWSPGQMYFFLGYRLINSADGKIVYSSQPVTLKIEQ